MKKFVFLFSAFFLLVSVNGFSENPKILTTEELLEKLPKKIEKEETKFSIRVMLEVRANEKNIEAELKSYLSRELRSLPDVLLVEKDYDWILGVSALCRDLREFQPYFYLVFIGYTVTRTTLQADEIALALVEPSSPTFYRLISGPCYNFVTTMPGLRIDARDGLKTACQEIVARFDQDCLEDSRKNYQQLKDYKETQEKELKEQLYQSYQDWLKKKPDVTPGFIPDKQEK